MKQAVRNNKDENDDPKELGEEGHYILRRYSIVVLLLGVLIVGISVFVFKIAFSEKERWVKVAATRQRPNQLVMPTRGNIYSADGKLMATSVPRYYMYIDFQADGFRRDSFLHSKTYGVDSLAFYLSKILKNRTPRDYRNHLMKGLRLRSREYPVYEGRVSFSELMEIKRIPYIKRSRNISGFYEKAIIQRQKFYGSLASRTLGDIYSEVETGGLPRGKNGLELQYDSLLRGKYGMKSTIRVGRSWTDVIEEEPEQGYDLITTIDVKMQDYTEQALMAKLKDVDAESGTAIVMEVKTGEIKAISNIERVAPGAYMETKTRNYAVADMIEPGSTFKIASIMVALDDKVCKPDDIVDAGNGRWKYEDGVVVDHNFQSGGFHQITVEQAIWYSSNIGVAKIAVQGYKDKPEKFIEGLSRVGMDADLNLEIPGAGHTKFSRPTDPKWSKLSLPWMSFGYELQTTPMQTLAFFNAIANNGKLIRPIFTKEIQKNGKTIQRTVSDVIKPSICSHSTLKQVKDMLVGAVEKGTGGGMRSKTVSIAGKTGTAQIATDGKYQSHHVSFCGYFPAEEPQYSCIVVVRRPRLDNPSAAAISGSVFRTIAEKIHSGHTQIDVKAMPPEPERATLPSVKNGDAKAIEYVLDELDVKTRPRRVKPGYAVGARDFEQELVEIKPLTTIDGLVPYVVGMGAKDAVYAVEASGMNVTLAGKGRVVAQSIQPGLRVVKGQNIVLTLKN